VNWINRQLRGLFGGTEALHVYQERCYHRKMSWILKAVGDLISPTADGAGSNQQAEGEPSPAPVVGPDVDELRKLRAAALRGKASPVLAAVPGSPKKQSQPAFAHLPEPALPPKHKSIETLATATAESSVTPTRSSHPPVAPASRGESDLTSQLVAMSLATRPADIRRTELVEKSDPAVEHARTQFNTSAFLSKLLSVPSSFTSVNSHAETILSLNTISDAVETHLERDPASVSSGSVNGGLAWLLSVYNKASRELAEGVPATTDEKRAALEACQGTSLQYMCSLIMLPQEDMYSKAPRVVGNCLVVPAEIAAAGTAALAMFTLLDCYISTSTVPMWGGPGETSVSLELLQALCSKLESDYESEELDRMFHPVVSHIMQLAASATGLISSDRIRALDLLAPIVKCRALASSLVRHSSFVGPLRLPMATSTIPNAGARMEQETLLGALLSPSTMPLHFGPTGMFFPSGHRGMQPPSPVLQEHFMDILHRSRAQVNATVQSLRDAVRFVVDKVHTLLADLLRVDAKGQSFVRDALLNWIHDILAANAQREKEQIIMSTVSSDGLFINLCVVLAKLCDPLWDNTATKKLFAEPPSSSPSPISLLGDKISVIEAGFLHCRSTAMWGPVPESARRAASMLVRTSPALGSQPPSGGPSMHAEDLLFSSKREEEYKFASRIFFYTMRAFTLGLVRIFDDVKAEDRLLNHMNRQASSSPQAKEQFEKLLSNKAAMDVVRQDPSVLLTGAKFCALAAEFVGRVCGGVVRLDSTELSLFLPFPASPYPLALSLPENFVSTPLHVLSFMTVMHNLMGPDTSLFATLATEKTIISTILHMFTALLSSSQAYIHSPHLRAEIGDTLYGMFLPASAKPHNDMDDPSRSTAADMCATVLYEPSRYCADNLAPALMGLYGDVEATGFYDKIGHRMKVTAMLQYLWSIPQHRPAFQRIASDAGRFTGFANGIVGHTTSMLTDALKGLPIIKDCLRIVNDPAAMAALSEEEQKEKRTQLEETTASVKGALMLTNQTSALLAVLTEDDGICDQLMREELVDRLTGMLMNSLVCLGTFTVMLHCGCMLAVLCCECEPMQVVPKELN
jgi:hypothetical protein